MMIDRVMGLLEAADPKDKESAYRNLEKMDIDRDTADQMAVGFYDAGMDDLIVQVKEVRS